MTRRITTGDVGGLLIIVCLWTACGQGPTDEVIEIEEPSPSEPIPPGEKTAYTAIKPIVDRECVRCHGGRLSPDLRTEAGFNSPKVKNEIASGDMPNDKRLSPGDKTKLLAYFGR